MEISNVFICLRPSIYALRDEHVTLEYFDRGTSPFAITITILRWGNDLQLPVTVRVNGYANWSAKQDYHQVALVEFVEYPELSWSKNWHITLESSRQPIDAMKFDRDADAFRYDICDRLWVGYKDAKGERQFIEADSFHTLFKEANV